MSLNLQSDKRTISFWDLVIQGISRKRGVKSAEPLHVRDLFVQLQKYRITNQSDMGNLTYEVASNKTSIVLEGISYDKDYVKVLFSVMDDKASRQTFRNVVTRRSRLSMKFDDERAEYSVHMVISQKEAGGLNHHYCCTVEECPATSVNYLIRALNAFLKRAAFKYPKKFLQKHPDNVIVNGEPEMMGTYSRVVVLGHPAEDFQKTLSDGSLSGISAITNYDIDNSVDGSQTVKPVARELKFSVSRSVVNDDNWGYLEKVRQYSLTGESNVLRVKFKDENEQPYTLSVDPVSGKLIDEKKFVKKLVLTGFTKELTTSSEGCFNQELVSKMSESLCADSVENAAEQCSNIEADKMTEVNPRLANEH
jgi:hypothetical protein